MNGSIQPTDDEITELVSHVLALRRDFVQRLFKSAGIPYSGLRKIELRERLHEAIATEELDAAEVVRFLDEVEPGGKQHVFLLRVPRDLNGRWSDPAVARRRLRRHAAVRDLLDASIPLLMPEELELSRIQLDDGKVEIVGVEARRYFERDALYDQEAVSDEGLPIELRAHVQRVARSTVVLRWNTATRHAALHITQASGGGLKHDHYDNVAQRFSEAVMPWLDFTRFRKANLAKVIHALHARERAEHEALTKSRRGRWETPDGAEIEAVSASTEASVFGDQKLRAAIGHVEDPASGHMGNMFWLPSQKSPLRNPLHITIIASDGRIHFMVPSSPDTVEHVIEQIRLLF